MRIVLSRQATGKEMVPIRNLYDQRVKDYKADPEAAAKLLAVGESSIDETLDANQVAAMADICLVIFNASEALTRK